MTSIVTKQDIGSLVKAIVMDNYEVTTEHWSRYAVLVSFFILFSYTVPAMLKLFQA